MSTTMLWILFVVAGVSFLLGCGFLAAASMNRQEAGLKRMIAFDSEIRQARADIRVESTRRLHEEADAKSRRAKLYAALGNGLLVVFIVCTVIVSYQFVD